MPSAADRNRRRLKHALVAIGVLIVLAGCGDSDQGDTSLPPAGPTAESAPGDGSPAVEPDVTDAGDVTGTDEGVEPVEMAGLQDEILADGVVTDEEMFLAMQATVECIEGYGFNASTGEQPTGGWSLTVGYQPEDAARVDEVTDLCEQEYSTAAQLRHAVGRIPAETDVDIDVLWDCLLERGVLDGSETEPFIAFQLADAANPEIMRECIELAENG